jgi:hypothetical protein
MWLFYSKHHETLQVITVDKDGCETWKRHFQHSLALSSMIIKHTHVETQNNKGMLHMFQGNVSNISKQYFIYTCFTSMFHAHVWMNEAYAHAMQVHLCRITPGVLHLSLGSKHSSHLIKSSEPETLVSLELHHILEHSYIG